MAGGACAAIGFFLSLLILDNKFSTGKFHLLGIITIGISLFGFISSLHSFEKEGKILFKICRIIEMIICGFNIVISGISLLFS